MNLWRDEVPNGFQLKYRESYLLRLKRRLIPPHTSSPSNTTEPQNRSSPAINRKVVAAATCAKVRSMKGSRGIIPQAIIAKVNTV